VDGDLTTRWSSQWSDPQWIYVDLGQRVQIDHVVLRWETAYGREYAIQVSDDAVTWTDPPHVFSRGGTDVVGPMQGVVGRYVRMYGFQRGTQWGYSLWSFEVYGTPVSPPPPSALPGPWKSADVGAVGMAGSASYANGTSDVSGAGIWGTSDAFQFVYQPISGDNDIVASVDSLQNTNPYAKAGVDLRDAKTASSPHVILDVRPDGSIEFMQRSVDGGTTMFIAGRSTTLPVYVMLVREGNTVTGSISSDGNAFTEVGRTTVANTGTALAGMAVTSHDTSLLNTSTFDSAYVTNYAIHSQPSPSPASAQNLAHLRERRAVDRHLRKDITIERGRRLNIRNMQYRCILNELCRLGRWQCRHLGRS
jgi:hypothetical protein